MDLRQIRDKSAAANAKKRVEEEARKREYEARIAALALSKTPKAYETLEHHIESAATGGMNEYTATVYQSYGQNYTENDDVRVHAMHNATGRLREKGFGVEYSKVNTFFNHETGAHELCTEHAWRINW